MTADKAELFAGYWSMLAQGQPEPEHEYRFSDTRRWRFDFAWPDRRVAVEIDGNAWHVKGGGRHGQSTDYEKMNAAVAGGWRVLRYTPGMLTGDPAGVIAQVSDLLTRA